VLSYFIFEPCRHRGAWNR